jgi:hypothetical protein
MTKDTKKIIQALTYLAGKEESKEMLALTQELYHQYNRI